MQLAFSTAWVYVDFAQHLNDFGQKVGVRKAKPRVFHVGALGRAFLAHLAQEREDVFVDDAHHFARLEVLEP